MDVLSSAEFRKRYPKLTEATAVTANGHVIGIWNPRGNGPAVPIIGHYSIDPDEPLGSFNTRPFTPVPKKGR